MCAYVNVSIVCVCGCVDVLHVCMEEGEENSFILRTRLSCEGVVLYLLCELVRDEWLCVLA